MAYIEPSEPSSRIVPLAFAVGGGAAATAGLFFDAKAAVFGAVVFIVALVVAIRETRASIITWPNALAVLIFAVWLIPIKLYRLPIDLPFNLEVYRLLIVVLLAAWVCWALAGRGGLTAAGHGKPLILLGVGALAAQIFNARALEAAGAGDTVLKSLTYFMSFLVVYVLVCSTIRTPQEALRLVGALVVGGAIVAAVAIYEANTRYNLFDHLASWIPALEIQNREVTEVRSGLLRVRSSSQHPIALGCALTLVIPLAIYLTRRATTRPRLLLWLVAAGLCTIGAVATISRTTLVMGVAMIVFALIVRARSVVRYWPVLLILPVLIHLAAPGSLGGLWKSFFPPEGLASSLEGRAGEAGSGRLADIGPGIDLWVKDPIVGSGLGSLAVTGETVALGPVHQEADPNKPALIFDNQYLNTLVALGIVGFIGVIWFAWGAAVKLARAARRRLDTWGDLAAAASISTAGFAAGMFFFDAFAFVQTTLVFFVIAAIGLRVHALTRDPESWRS